MNGSGKEDTGWHEWLRQRLFFVLFLVSLSLVYATTVLYVRVRILEGYVGKILGLERNVYSIQKQQEAMAEELLHAVTDIQSIKYRLHRNGTRAASTSSPPATRPRPTPSPAGTPSRPKGDVEEAVRSAIETIRTEARKEKPSERTLQSVYERLTAAGPATVPLLLDSLERLPEEEQFSWPVYDAIAATAVFTHRQAVLSLLPSFPLLAKTALSLNLRDAVPVMKEMLKKAETHLPRSFIEALLRMDPDGAPHLVAEYAARTADTEGVAALDDVGGYSKAVTLALSSILRQRERLAYTPEGRRVLEEAAAALTRRGNREGLAYVVSVLREEGTGAVGADTLHALARCVEFEGDPEELPFWLVENGDRLTWSKEKGIFRLSR